jgi:hypothetical protein
MGHPSSEGSLTNFDLQADYIPFRPLVKREMEEKREASRYFGESGFGQPG